MTKVALVVIVALLSVGALTAQVGPCPYSPVILSYGQGCNTAFPTPASLSGSFDPLSCSLTLTPTTFPGCCNTYLVERVLLLGLTSDGTSVPAYPSCTLYVVPDLAIIPFSFNTTSLTFSLPPGLPPVTIYAQAGFVYFTTIGFNYDLALTNGLAITI
jgi:hypothetical protein